MKITIIGGGNMGGAIAYGLASENNNNTVSVIDTSLLKAEELKSKCNSINIFVDDYEPLYTSDIIIIALKPWLVEQVLTEHKDKLSSKQLIISIAAGISLAQLSSWIPSHTPAFRVMPNTAIAIKQSMTFVSSQNASKEQESVITELFGKLGKVQVISENLIPAATALSSCGIAYAFRYIRAAMEGGIEMGFYPDQSRDILIQTLRGAIDLLETNQSHPETEIDKVTTPGGVTIKGLNEMEHAGFTSAVIKGLKASHIK